MATAINPNPAAMAFLPDVFCLYKNRSESARKYYFPKDEVQYVHQAFFIQIILISLIHWALSLLLKPLGQTPAVAMMLATVIVGPSGLAQIHALRRAIFPLKGMILVETLGKFTCMIYLFLISVKLDLSTAKTSSRKARLIGISTFVIPLVMTLCMAVILKDSAPPLISPFLPVIAVIESSTSLQAINCLLTDLQLLNTELGHVATSASMISGIFSWITIAITFGVKQSTTFNLATFLKVSASACCLFLFITYFLRKFVIWIIRRTPHGEPLKETHLLVIYLMVFGTGFLGEMMGQHWFFGPVILGLAIPDGPPIGSALENNLNYLTSGLLLPIFLCDVASKLFILEDADTIPWILLFSLLGFFGKLIGTIIPCVFKKMSFSDSILLGLILSTRGIFDLGIFSLANSMRLINLACFAKMVVNALVVTGIISPIVHFLYNPSIKYIVNMKRAIENSKANAELRILVCLYNQENVPSIINLLEASNPTSRSPILVFLLHLIELTGRASPLLIAHNPNKDMFEKPTASDNIINGFKLYEKTKRGVVNIQTFTAITPFVSAHDDICTMAFDKKTTLIIIPFHKQWNLDGTKESSKCRNINKKLLTEAPCSVGILIDRGKLNRDISIVSLWSTHNVGVIFLGGNDDREALSYAMRMAKHPNIHLTLHHLIPLNNIVTNMNEKMLDNDLIFEYRDMENENVLYKEELIEDCLGIVNMIRTMEINEYDVILVGRRQRDYSKILSGLAEWNEYPELGFFGDMLASSDFKSNVSVLVVQQHSPMKN